MSNTGALAGQPISTAQSEPQILVEVNIINSHIERLQQVAHRIDNTLDRIRPPEPCNPVETTKEQEGISNNILSLLCKKNTDISDFISTIETQLNTLENYI